MKRRGLLQRADALGGAAVTFAVMAGGSASPVTFECGTTVLGTVNLSGSDPTYEEAVFTTSALPDGSDTVTAAYNGDDNYNSASTTTS